MQKVRGNRFQIRIPVRAVNHGDVMRLDIHGTSAKLKRKVGRVRIAGDIEFVEGAVVLALRGQNSRDSFQRRKIGVRKRKLSLNRSETQIIRIPRTKLSLGVDVPGGLG